MGITGQDIIEFFKFLFDILCIAVVGTVKALLPTGVLPRKDVHGEIVMITGAGSGIGRLLAIEFAKLGAKLVLWDINAEGNARTKEILENYGTEVHTYTVDLAKRLQINETAKKVKEEVGAVNILINNAGVVTGKKLLECPDELIELTMAVNTNALLFTTKAFLPQMMESDHGHIVNMSSMAGIFGIAGLADYCASKFAVVGFSQSIAAELHAQHKNGVNVTAVCPFFVNTGMFEGAQTKSPLMLPMLEPDYVVAQIMEAVLTNREILMMPRFCYLCVYLAGFLPCQAALAMSDYFGLNECMSKFVGRQRPN